MVNVRIRMMKLSNGKLFLNMIKY